MENKMKKILDSLRLKLRKTYMKTLKANVQHKKNKIAKLNKKLLLLELEIKSHQDR